MLKKASDETQIDLDFLKNISELIGELEVKFRELSNNSKLMDEEVPVEDFVVENLADLKVLKEIKVM